jgi:hypothetical protein
VAFLYWPFIQGAAYSFTNSQGYGEFKWIGFKNYGAMFSDSRVRNAYLFTILIAIIITIGTNLLALLLSVMLNGKIAFKNGFRAVFFIPFTLGDAGHRLRVQIYVHGADSRAWAGAAYLVAVDLDADEPAAGVVPDRVPVDLAGRRLHHADLPGWPADHRRRAVRGGGHRRREHLAALLEDHASR